MNFKDLLSAAKKTWQASGAGRYVKFLDPYYPAQKLAEKGRYDLGAIYFMSWYVILAAVLMGGGKKKEEQQPEEAKH